MKAAISNGTFDRFVLLQGLEYPIASNADIDSFFFSHSGMEFIKAQNISISGDIKDTHKYRLYYFWDYRDNFFIRVIHRLNYLVRKTGHIPSLKPNYAMREGNKQMQIYQGCAQFGLTQEAVKYIIEFHDSNPRFNRYFKSVYAVDEAYFHTIIYNSHFVNSTVDGKAVTRSHLTDFENLTYFEYPREVRLFTKVDEWPVLRDSGFLYFRKASSQSKQLLDYIDSIHQGEISNI